MSPARSQRFIEGMVLLVTILGTGMVYLDQTAVNVALPANQVDLRADVGGLQWLVDIYILTLAALLLIGGALGDVYGRVRVFIIGMAVFVVASIAAGLANSLAVLVAARALQGVGGALLVPGGLAIINATVAAERRGQVLGTWGALSPLVSLSGPLLSGPLLGGWLMHYVSWRAVFFINVPLGLLACYIAARFVPENRDETASGRLDWPGVFTLLVGLSGVLFGLIEGPNFGWGHPLVIFSLLAGVLGLAAFVAVEARSRAPLLPLHLFRNRTFTGINLVTLVHYLSLSSVFFFLTLNLQQAQGYTAFQAGLAQLPISLLLMFMARPVGQMTDRIGAVPLIAVGVALNGVGLLMLAGLGIGGSYWTTFFPALLVFGVGLGLMVVPLTVVALSALDSRYSGVASGFNNAISRIAQMLAVAIFGAVLVAGFRGGLEQRTASLGLDPGARAQLLSEARNLGATQPPASLSPELAAAAEQAIRLAFVDGFRVMMIIAGVLSLLSLALLLALVRHHPSRAGRPAAERAPLSGD